MPVKAAECQKPREKQNNDNLQPVSPVWPWKTGRVCLSRQQQLTCCCCCRNNHTTTIIIVVGIVVMALHNNNNNNN